MDLVCLQGHSLTGEEKRDVTGAFRCPTCAQSRKKNWQLEDRGFSGVRYRRYMKESDPSSEAPWQEGW